MIKNPYKYTGPLDPEKDNLVCIPRSEYVKDIIEGIKKDEYWAVLGPRQIGKTTFIRQIQKKITNAFHIYFNLEVTPKTEKQFYRWLMDRILEEIPSKERDVQLKKRKKIGLIGRFLKFLGRFIHDHRFRFLKFLEEFTPLEDKKIILLFDEVEGVHSLKEFLKLWKTIHSERYHNKALNKYSVITTGSFDLVSLTTGPTSPFNIAKTLHLKDFTDEESQRLINESFAELNINIEQKAKETLIKQISGHPQMLQQACHNLVEIASSERRNIQEQDIDTTIETLLKTNTNLGILKQDLKENQKLEGLIIDIFKGLKITYHPHKELSFLGAGCIVEDKNSFCTIRNKVYKIFLMDVIGKDFDIYLIKEKSQDLFFEKEEKKKKPLPYALKQFRIKNYYGIKETGISDLPLDTQWIFLTGDNAFGKTVTLQALTIGLFGEIDEDTILTGDQKKCRVSIEVHTPEGIQENNLGDRDFISFKNFAVYGPSRLEIQSPETQNAIKDKSSQTYSIFNSDGILLNIEHELLMWHLKKKEDKFKMVKEALLQLLPHVADIKIDEIPEKDGKEKKDKVIYTEKESKGKGRHYKHSLTFNQLASGHKSIIAMVGDILIRLYDQQPEVLNPNDLSGLVIIDELDLHLHPKWQRKLPLLLSKVFPKVQFIVSTHSVIPFLGASEKSIFFKVTRNLEDGIQIQRIDIDIKNLLPNSILTSPLFDLDGIDIIPEMNQSIYETRTEDTHEEITKNDEIRKKLEAFEETDKDFPDELFETD